MKNNIKNIVALVLVVCFSLLAALFFFAQIQQSNRIKKIIQEAIIAYGGEDTLENIADCKRSARIIYSAKADSSSHKNVLLHYKSPDKIRLVSLSKEENMTYSYDGVNTYLNLELVTDADIKEQLQENITFWLFHEKFPLRLKDLDVNKILYLGKANINDEDADVIEIEIKNGLKEELFFNRSSHLLAKIKRKLSDDIEEEIYYFNYQTIPPGIKRPLSSKVYRNGELYSMVYVDAIVYNSGIDDAAFKLIP